MRNGLSYQGLQTGPRRNPASYSKKRIFGPKSEVLGPIKKRALLSSNRVLATSEQSCAKKKVQVSQMNISLFADLGCFVLEKWIFGPFSAFQSNVRRRLLRNSGRDQVRCQCGSFFGGHGPKLWVIILAIGEWPEMPKVQDEPRKMTRTSERAVPRKTPINFM